MAVSSILIDIGPLRSSQPFRRLWIGRCCLGLGAQMTLVAVMFQVWQQTHSTAWTGAVGVSQAIPLVAVGLVAGSLADRRNRRMLYLVGLTGQAAGSIALAVQGLSAHLPVAGVLVILAAQSCFVAISGPVSRTFVSGLLPKEQVGAGLALNRISFQGSMVLGPAIGGLVIGAFGIGACYLIDAVSFGAAFYGAVGLPSIRPSGAGARPGVGGMLEGFGFMVRDRMVRGALITDLAATALSFPVSLFPALNARWFGNDPRTLGLFLTALAVGGVAASTLSGGFTRHRRPGPVMLIAAAGWGGALVAFALSPDPWFGLAFLTVAGAMDTVSVIARGTVIQSRTPDELMGRVVAAELVIGRAGPDVGNLRAGLVAGATSGTLSLLSGGLLCVAAVAAVAASTPEMRHDPHLVQPVQTPPKKRTIQHP